MVKWKLYSENHQMWRKFLRQLYYIWGRVEGYKENYHSLHIPQTDKCWHQWTVISYIYIMWYLEPPLKKNYTGLPWWRSGWESVCQCRGHGFEPWSGKIPHAAEQLGPWATITEPARLCSATREAAIVRGPRTAMKSGPRLPQLEKALTQKRRPNTAINKIK